MRSFNRSASQLRPVTLEVGVNRYAEGSCMVTFGHTKVLCTASLDERVPPFLYRTGKGWVTAEYGMLPRATHTRNQREVNKGKPSGRTHEIQRLIGRSLRSCVDLNALGERQIVVDCDVIEADGGTRTASITGGFVALHLALQKLHKAGTISTLPVHHQVAAVSCGVLDNNALLDLDYEEDSAAEVDANFVITSTGKLVEVQATGEEHVYEEAHLHEMLALAKTGIAELTAKQKEVLGIA